MTRRRTPSPWRQERLEAVRRALLHPAVLLDAREPSPAPEGRLLAATPVRFGPKVGT